MFVPTPKKCIAVFLQMLYWFTSLLLGLWLCPLQNITKLCLENSRQKFSLTKNSLQNLTYFQNVISNPVIIIVNPWGAAFLSPLTFVVHFGAGFVFTNILLLFKTSFSKHLKDIKFPMGHSRNYPHCVKFYIK
jgi:hypothetical protein